jgi:hypothetical protein
MGTDLSDVDFGSGSAAEQLGDWTPTSMVIHTRPRQCRKTVAGVAKTLVLPG